MRRIVLALSVLGAVSTGAVAASDYDCAYDPKTTHMSRTVAADSTGAPIYGVTVNDAENKSNARTLDLHDHELVLTFDDGPLGSNTQSILDTLQKHCVKAIFFSVGRMARSQPKLIQEVDRRGHTIGTHTWSHPRAMHELSPEDNMLEIEKGFAAVSDAVGKPIAPFFRFPGFRDSRAAVAYLAKRNISVWGADIISGDADAGGASAAQITRDVLNRVHSTGKGIVLFHDIKKSTAEALDGILTELEREKYKFVQVVSNTYYQPDPQLLARADLFRNTPETATITGRWLASPGQKVKDGSVDVMHTEWIDLDAEIANEKLTGGAPAAPAQRSDAQPGSFNTANGWRAAQGQVR
jgi:peptidoglycan/xylan/chitin deacetylase (PgdA/CDA1 family)